MNPDALNLGRRYFRWLVIERTYGLVHQAIYTRYSRTYFAFLVVWPS